MSQQPGRTTAPPPGPRRVVLFLAGMAVFDVAIWAAVALAR